MNIRLRYFAIAGVVVTVVAFTACALFYFVVIRGSARDTASPATADETQPTTAEVIVDSGLYLRTAPSVEGKPVTELKKGDQLKVLEYKKGRRWCKVETEAGEVGWVDTYGSAGPTLAFSEADG